MINILQVFFYCFATYSKVNAISFKKHNQEGMNSLNFDADHDKVSVSSDKQRLIFKQVRHHKKQNKKR